jgi:Flp pilus assembly pilin Flp
LSFLYLYVALRSAVARRARRDEHGQASAEYALVLLGAAGVALLVMTWAKQTDRVAGLLDTVFDHLLGRVP